MTRYKIIDSKEEYQEKILQYRPKGYEYLQEINEYLKCKDQASIEAYLSLFLKEEFQNHFVPCLDDLGYAQIFAAITLEELKNNRTVLFIDHGQSIEALKRFYTKIKFLLWNMEFKIIDTAESQLYEFLATNQISVEAIKIILSILGFFRVSSYLVLIVNYLEHQRFSEAIRLFEYAAECFPGNKEILEPLAQLCRAVGNDTLAVKYEEQLKNNQQKMYEPQEH